MSDTKREKIKQKIEAGEARIRETGGTDFLERTGEAAIEAKDRFTNFAKEHPLTTIAGGLAVGVLISGMFRNSPTRRLGRKASDMAAIGAEAALAYLMQAADAAGNLGHRGDNTFEHLGGRLDKLSTRVGSATRSAAHDASEMAEEASDNAKVAGRKLRKRFRQKMHNFHSS